MMIMLSITSRAAKNIFKDIFVGLQNFNFFACYGFFERS